jgi:hypothetical protein
MSLTHSFDSSTAVPSLARPDTPIGSDAWLRALVAAELGVADATLAPGISLRDDLAADSLDLAVLASASRSCGRGPGTRAPRAAPSPSGCSGSIRTPSRS